MEPAHPEERPLKKRRFFAEESSPPQVLSIRHDSPPSVASPEPSIGSAASPVCIADIAGQHHGGDFGDFDVGTLQAIVGELPLSTLQKLKDVSDGDVQRGR